MKKVYCKKCCFYCQSRHGCTIDKNIKLVDGWYEQKMTFIEKPEDKNRDNSCNDYKEKIDLKKKCSWWKRLFGKNK